MPRKPRKTDFSTQAPVNSRFVDPTSTIPGSMVIMIPMALEDAYVWAEKILEYRNQQQRKFDRDAGITK